MLEKPRHRSHAGTGGKPSGAGLPGHVGADNAAGAAVAMAATLPPVDMTRMESLANGDETGLRELAELYLEQTGRQVKQLRAAIQAGIPDEVRRLAHSCAGASSTCGMNPILRLFRELEREGSAGRLRHAEELAASVNHEFGRIQEFLRNQFGEKPVHAGRTHG